MAGRSEIIALNKRIQYNAHPEPWSGQSQYWGYASVKQNQIIEALREFDTDDKVLEISLKISEAGHYVCMHRMPEGMVAMGQVRIDKANRVWSERQIKLSDLTRESFSNIVIWTGMVMQDLPQMKSYEKLAEKQEARIVATEEGVFFN